MMNYLSDKIKGAAIRCNTLASFKRLMSFNDSPLQSKELEALWQINKDRTTVCLSTNTISDISKYEDLNYVIIQEKDLNDLVNNSSKASVFIERFSDLETLKVSFRFYRRKFLFKRYFKNKEGLIKTTDLYEALTIRQFLENYFIPVS